MAKSEFQFCFPFRIRYGETDAQGIVFNAHYLTFFDTAIYEYFRALPYNFIEHVNRTGQDFHTVKVTVEFLAPARFDDEIEAWVRAGKTGRSSLTFAVEVYRKGQDELLVRGEVVWVNADQNRQKAASLPPELIDRIRAMDGLDEVRPPGPTA